MDSAKELSASRRFTILCAEDNAELRRLWIRFLREEGFRAIECPNGRTALLEARSRLPDLIILDANLGDADGFEICAKLKRSRITEDIPILMVSGTYFGPDFRKKALRLGAVDYLSKPIEDDVLARAIQLGLKSRQGPVLTRHVGKVLVADDDVCWVKLVAGWLSAAGYEVITTQDQAAVFRLTLAERPDCIVLDYHWNTETAADLVEELRRGYETRVIPIVILTGVESVKLPILYKGADHFVAKDGKSEDLLAAVHVSVRRRESDRGALERGDLKLDPEGYKVVESGMMVALLTGPQFTILYMLVQASPKPVLKGELYRAVMPDRSPKGSHALEQLIQRLKSRLPANLSERIVNVRDLGWLFSSASSSR